MLVNVTGAKIVETSGSDDIFLETNLPSPVWPYTGTTVLKMQAAKGSGYDYVLDNLGIKAAVIAE